MQKKEMKILIAAKANNFAFVYKIFLKIDKSKAKGKSKSYIDIDAKNLEGATALHYAASYGNIEMMQELLSRGALIDACDKNGWRPLSYASASNKWDAVAKLIEWGSDVNLTNEENSPIHIAAALGHGDIVRVLMEKGANIHKQNQRHQTPVDVACENNHYGVVNVLLSASSKQIEEFSESSFRSISKKSLSPSIMKTSTLPASMSNSNITNMSLNSSFEWNDKTPNLRELKRRTIGSQEQISNPERFDLQTFKSHPTKKCESLNVIFVQDEDTYKDQDHVTASPRSKTLNYNCKTDLEIFVPYPSKFPTSDILKIKSPLLPLKGNHFIEQNNIRKGIGVQITNSSHKGDTNSDAESKTELIKYRDNINNFQSNRGKNKTARSSLPLQSHYSLRTTSPTQASSVEVAALLVNGKPPVIKPKVKNLSQSYRNTAETFVDKLTSKQGSRNRDYCGNLISASAAEEEGISCLKWIRSIGLLMIWDTLVKEGFESFLSLSLASDEELLILCNNQIDYLDNLKTHLDSLSIPSTNQLEFSLDIQKTLIQLGLEEYYVNFVKQGYLYMDQLPLISELFMNELGITKMGHRRLLIECLTSNVQKKVKVNESYVKNGSVSHLPTLSSDHSFSRRDIRNKCNSLPRYNSHNIKPKRSPPPIPPRSCSIPDDHFTLNDILIESMCQENISPKKKDYCASRDTAGDFSNLDDIVNMLTNLGKELDNELNHIE